MAYAKMLSQRKDKCIALYYSLYNLLQLQLSEPGNKLQFALLQLSVGAATATNKASTEYECNQSYHSPQAPATTTSGKWGAYNVANSFYATLYKQQF